MKKKEFLSVLMVLLLLFFSFLSAEDVVLRIITEEYHPLSFTNSDGEVSGLGTDVVREITRRIGHSDNIQVLPWARAYRMAQTEPDIALFTVTMTEERRPMFKWVGPIGTMRTGFYGRAGSNVVVNNIEDAKNLRRVGAYRDGFDEQILLKKGFTNLDSTGSMVTNINKLMAGRIDVTTATNVTIRGILEETDYKMQDIKDLYTFFVSDFFIAFSLEVPDEVVETWQNALNEMKKDGTFAEIYEKWLPGEIPSE